MEGIINEDKTLMENNMYKKESETLKIIKKAFGNLSDLQGTNQMCRYDASNQSFIVELKARASRFCSYPDTMIEKSKFDSNMSTALSEDKKFIYAVHNQLDNHIYLWDVTGLDEDYDYNWRTQNCKKTTTFTNTKYIKKEVGGLKWADAKYKVCAETKNKVRL